MAKKNIAHDGHGQSKSKRCRRKATDNSHYLHDEDVAERINISRDSVWRWSKAGKLPSPIKLGDNCTRWLRSEIEKWQADQEREE